MIVYRAISPSGKSYIGITKDLEYRKHKHFLDSKKRKYRFPMAVNKYGIDKFKWEVLAECKTREEACKLEIYYIKHYNTIDNGYNITPGGNGGAIRKNIKNTRESLLKTSIKRCDPVNVFLAKDLSYIGTWQMRSECEKALGLKKSSVSAYLRTKVNPNTWSRKKIHGYYMTTDSIDYVCNNKRQIIKYLNTYNKNSPRRQSEGLKSSRKTIKKKMESLGFQPLIAYQRSTGLIKTLYSIQEASRYLGITYNKLRRHIKGIKEIPGITLKYIQL